MKILTLFCSLTLLLQGCRSTESDGDSGQAPANPTGTPAGDTGSLQSEKRLLGADFPAQTTRFEFGNSVMFCPGLKPPDSRDPVQPARLQLNAPFVVIVPGNRVVVGTGAGCKGSISKDGEFEFIGGARIYRDTAAWEKWLQD